MTHLKNKVKFIVFLLSILVGGTIIHYFLIPEVPREKASVSYGPREKIGKEIVREHPPAYFICEKDNLHYLAQKPDGELKYIKMDKNFNLQIEKKIPLAQEVQIEYIFPVGEIGEKLIFGAVIRERNTDTVYTFEFDGRWEKEEKFLIARGKDVQAKINEETIYFTYVTRENGKYNLYLKETDGEQRLISSSENFMGLPRLTVTDDKKIHLVWKGTRGALGKTHYRVFDWEEDEMAWENSMELGDASIYYGDISGQPRLFQQDPGPDLMAGESGNVFVGWTDAMWEPLLGTYSSEINIVELSGEGEIEDRWVFQGPEEFSVFPFFFIGPEETISVMWEDYSQNRFSLKQSVYDSQIGSFGKPENLTHFYGSHRLARVENNSRGEVTVLWRQMEGNIDSVWGRKSVSTPRPEWYQRWNLWFLEDGGANIFVEGALILFYSFLGAAGFLARNALIITLVAFLLYLFQSYRLLGHLNFFLFLSLFLVLITVSREFFTFLYGTPAAEEGLVFFSGLIATALVMIIGRKHWLKAGDEISYLKFSVYWIFADSFVQLLLLSPSFFMP